MNDWFLGRISFHRVSPVRVQMDSIMMSREDGATYTGVVVFTLGFDSQHRAFARKVGKTKTTVEE